MEFLQVLKAFEEVLKAFEIIFKQLIYFPSKLFNCLKCPKDSEYIYLQDLVKLFLKLPN